MKEGWQTKRLTDVATLQRGFDLPTQNRVHGKFPLVSSSGISDTHYKSAVLGPGVVTGRSGSIGNVFYIEGDFWPLNTVLYVKDFHGNDPRFIYHLLKNFDLKRFATGTGVPTLNRNFVHDELVFVPPIAEQLRIVRFLDEALDGITSAKTCAEKNLQNAHSLFESFLDAIFCQRGEGWVNTKLGDVCQKITDGTHITPTYTNKGVPFLSVKNLTKGFIDFSDTRFISPEEHAFLTRNCKPMRDDILYTKVGTTGVAKVIDVDEEFSIFVSVALLKLKHDIIFNSYLEHFLNAPFAREQARKRTRGMANKNLVITDIKEIVIYYPKSLNEQHALVAKLDTFRAETKQLESIYKSKLAALDDLKKSLLHQAFHGEL